MPSSASYVSLLFALILLSSPRVFAQEAQPKDPLETGRTVIESNELVLSWADPDTPGTFRRQLFDYVSYGNPELQDSLQAQGEQATDGALRIAGDEAMDVVVGNFDGEGAEETIMVWEGDNLSIIVSMPGTDLELGDGLPKLVWTEPQEFVLKPAGTLGELDETPRVIRLQAAQFDDDPADELLLAYNDTDDAIRVEVFDLEGNTLVSKREAALVTLPQADLNNVDDSAIFDVAAGDLDDDGIAEIIVGTAEQVTAGCTASFGCWEAYVAVFDGTTLAERDRTTIFSKTTNQNRWLNRIAVQPGDYDGDGVDELAVGYHVAFNGSTHEWYLQGAAWDTSTQTLVANLDNRVRVEGTQGNRGFPLTLLANDMDQDGLDEVLYVGRQLHVYASDTLTARYSKIANASLGTQPGNASRRAAVLADLDGSSGIWYSETDETVRRPEIVVARTFDFTGSNGTDSAIELMVFRYTPGQFVLDQLSSLSVAPTDLSGGRPLLLASGDFGDRGVRLGPPQFFRRTEVVQPLVILNAPPIHYDVFGETPFDLSSCFGNGGCGFSATYTEQTTSTVEVSTEVRGDWQLGAGIEGSLGDVLGDIPVAGDLVGGLLDALGLGIDFSFSASYGEGFSELVGQSTTIQLTSRVETVEEDAIYASVLDYDIWEYPLYVRSRFVGHIVLVLPQPQRDQWFTTNTPEAASYRPAHEFGNILSYPADIETQRSARRLYQGSRYTLSSQEITWDVTREQTQFSESTETTSFQLEGDVDISTPIPSLEVNLNGDYSRETINTHMTSVTNLQAVSVELGPIATTAEGLQANYSVTPFVYWDRSGALVVDYAVEPSIADLGDVETWWQMRYGQAPDLALNLPQRYADLKTGDAIGEATRTRTKGIQMYPAEAMPGEVVSIQAEIFNYSLLPTSNDVAVRFYAGNPNDGGVPITGVDGIADPRIQPLAARGSGTVRATWTVPSGLNTTAVRIYAVIDPENAFTEIHETNNLGWAPLRLAGVSVANEADPLAEQPTTPMLDQNYPNPFNPSTTIRYTVPQTAPVRLAIYDLLGREVAVLVDGRQTAGAHHATFDASHLASGLYLYRLQTAGHVISRTMLLVK